MSESAHRQHGPAGSSAPRILCGAWTVGVLLFLYLPIVLLVAYSFNDSRLTVEWKGFTTRWYGELAHNEALILTARNSLIIAAATAAASVILGTAGAWSMYRYRFPLAGIMRTLIGIPILMPDVVMGVSLLILFAVGCQFGNAWLSRFNLGDDHLGLGFTTVVIGHVTFCFPFVLVAVYARLIGMDPSLEEAAMDLGATPTKAFWRVIVPYLRPSIISGGLMAFTLSMDELVVTYFIYGPSSETLPVKVFGMARVGVGPMLNAASTVFVVATTLLVVGAAYFGSLKQEQI